MTDCPTQLSGIQGERKNYTLSKKQAVPCNVREKKGRIPIYSL